MSRDPADVLPPRILVVDDERQIHASVRLRLGRDYEMVSCFDAREALERLRHERFDLCLADIHMPHMDGLTFIEQARQVDPALGYVILSAFDSGENLRRAIPLQVFDFLGKPLPEREGFERRIPEWVDRTRRQRHDLALADSSRSVAQQLASAQLAHEVELVASESARDALLQTANLLTTIHAHLVTANALLAPRAKSDPSLSHLLRNLDEARKTSEAAVSVAETFFNSAYANRDSSPAFIDAGLRHAIGIAQRLCRADEANKAIDFTATDERIAVRGLSGIDLLLLLVPAIGAAVTSAPSGTTVRIAVQPVARLDSPIKDTHTKSYLWLNRKHALTSQPGVLVSIGACALPLTRSEAEAWFKGEPTPLSLIASRGLVAGLQRAHGLLGLPIAPASENFRLLLALPA